MVVLEVLMNARFLHRSVLPLSLLFPLVAAAVAASCGGSNQILGKTGSEGSGGAGADGGPGSGAGSSSNSASTGLFVDGGGDGGVVSSTYPCTGCPTFPAPGAPTCPASTLGPATISYPLDGLLLPPNMNVLEVQFVPPAGAMLFEVDFENGVTDVKVETQCNPVTPVRGGPSPGCGITLPRAPGTTSPTPTATATP
jgi:hypothetical protein